jgi:hypothetical protein
MIFDTKCPEGNPLRGLAPLGLLYAQDKWEAAISKPSGLVVLVPSYASTWWQYLIQVTGMSQTGVVTITNLSQTP